ncbi:hypothetical protein AX15_003354 [Amanita polypyramis BW_CC]|nr:hypothetical protein AX15_003354 [Amanita polypyramis BW_CC]
MKNSAFVGIVLALMQCSLWGAALVPRRGDMLVIRQASGSNGNGTQCESLCTTVMQYTSSGPLQCTIQECCTDMFVKEYHDCYTCIGQAANITDFSRVQQNLNNLVANCAANGVSVTSQTFPGQTSNSTTSSSSSAASSATSGVSTSLGTRTSSTIASRTTISTISTPSQSAARTSGSSSAASKTVGDTFLPLVLLGFCSQLLGNWVL